MQGLMAHVDTQRIDRAILATLPDPEPLPGSRSHKPVRHDVVVNEIEAALGRVGWEVTATEQSLSSNLMKLFGVMHIAPAGGEALARIGETAKRTSDEGRGFMFGYRHGNDQSMALKGVAGTDVFVCDNMMFSGSELLFSRKHTGNLDLKGMIAQGVAQLPVELIKNEQGVYAMADNKLDDNQAKLAIFNAVAESNVCTAKYMVPIWETYRDATPQNAPEVADAKGSMWGVHNAFTRVFNHGHKDMNPMSNTLKFESTLRLGKYCEVGV